jgi:hypothetical protein
MTEPQAASLVSQVEDRLLAELVKATETLRDDALWRQLLAENLMWSSCEGFIQCSILGAFNLASSEHIADRERKLTVGGDTQPYDLLIMRRSDYRSWWVARNSGDRSGLGSLCCGTVELKLVWTKDNAYGSATATNKAIQIAADIEKLANLCCAVEDCRGYVGVLCSGLHNDGKGDTYLQDAMKIVQARSDEARLAREQVTVPLLARHELSHWQGLQRGDPAPLLWAQMTWLTIGHSQGTI